MSKGSVLVLDDEEIVVERLGDYLRQRDFTVETFTDSQQALDRLAQQRFDLVITDLKMKGPNGLDVVHFVRSNHPGTEMIVITGFASMETAREAEYAGVGEFLTKPFKLEQLGKLVAKAVRRARRNR